jgi:hypothetical protein
MIFGPICLNIVSFIVRRALGRARDGSRRDVRKHVPDFSWARMSASMNGND